MRYSLTAALLAATFGTHAIAQTAWSGYGRDAQHSALSSIAGKPLLNKHWFKPVDEILQNTAGELLVHYASPSITAANTVLVPVRTLADTFRVDAVDGATGNAKYT